MPTDTNDGSEKSEVLLYVEEVIKRENKKILLEKKREKIKQKKKELVNSYGSVLLNNNMIINVKYNFFFLEQLWEQWVYAKSFDMKEELEKLKVATNGGLFNCGDMVFYLDDIKVLFKPELYFNSSPEQRMTADMKNAMMNTYISTSVFNSESIFFEIDDEDEDDEEDDD